MDDFTTFLNDVNYRSLHYRPSCRKGQAFMNALHDIRPDLYHLITATPADPFYRDDKLPEAINFLAEHF